MYMKKILYYWSKFLKKMRCCAIVNSEIHKTSKIESGSHIVGSIMGKYSFCGYDCQIINTQIGAFCSIANNVVIGGAMHPISWVSTSPVFYKGRDSVKMKFSEFVRDENLRTVIGNDVWIGQNVLIKQGVNIGNGAIIGMGSIIVKDVPSYSIVAGNPARLIRMRFSPFIVESLEKSEWWNLSEEKLMLISKFIREPEKFILNI